MHPDDLKVIWICHECGMKFLFPSDVEDHKNLTGHKLIEKVMMMISSRDLGIIIL